MSTLEMPACFALLLVMANLALCLSADTRQLRHTTNLPSVSRSTGMLAPDRCNESAGSTRPC